MLLDRIDREELQQLLRDDSMRLRFPQKIEALYQHDTLEFRMEAARRSITLCLIAYVLGYTADFLVVPEMMVPSAILHFCVIGPMLLFCYFYLGPDVAPRQRYILMGAAPLLVIGQIMYVFFQSQTLAAGYFQFFASSVPLYLNITQRLGMKFSLITNALIMFLYTSVLLSSSASVELIGMSLATMANCIVVSLMANVRMESDFRDSYLRRLDERLRREDAEADAGSDSLTGLANRRQFEAQAESLEADGAGRRAGIALVMIDVDHFKAFNDRYGHQEGDVCLRRVADAIRTSLRDHRDLAARFGGEEFLVMLPEAGLAEAAAVAERIRTAIQSLAIANEGASRAGVVTASFGVATGQIGTQPLSSLLRQADLALYAAKSAGRNRVETADGATRSSPPAAAAAA